jgi:hypothetical protein
MGMDRERSIGSASCRFGGLRFDVLLSPRDGERHGYGIILTPRRRGVTAVPTWGRSTAPCDGSGPGADRGLARREMAEAPTAPHTTISLALGCSRPGRGAASWRALTRGGRGHGLIEAVAT